MKTRARKRLDILFVDDDPILLLVVAERLNKERYQVVTSLSGGEALTLAEKRPFDLAVIDYEMPDTDGLDVAKAFKSLNLPFIFLTVSTDRDVADKATRNGALGYIIKPAYPEEIEIQIETALLRGGDIQNLEKAVDINGVIGVATGLVMLHSKLPVMEALQRLRDYCRPRRLRLYDVADQLVRDYEAALSSDPKAAVQVVNTILTNP